MQDGATTTDDISAPLALPSDRELMRVETLAARCLTRGGMTHVVGCQGSAAAWIGHAVAAHSQRCVVYIAPSLETARRAADDLDFFARQDLGPADSPSRPLLFTPSETNPYAEAHPERRGAMNRLAVLHRMAVGLPWRFLVTSPSALLRRVVPKQQLLEGSEQIQAESLVDHERLLERLSRAGYLRVPVVEDAGSYAVRGGILDVWPPGSANPVRAELDGDLVLSLAAFDPESQRTGDPVDRAFLPPAREAILTPDIRERARAVARSLCDAVNLPSTKARKVSDDIADARAYFGAEGFLPAYYPLEPLWSYIPDDVVLVIERPEAVRREIVDQLEVARSAEQAKTGLPHFPLDALYVSEHELGTWLERRTVIAAHRFGVAGSSETVLDRLESVPIDAPSMAIRDHSDLERAVKTARASHGKHGVLDPLVARLKAWSDAGLETLVTARSATQADRLQTLLSHRDVELSRADEGAPRLPRLVVGTLARGAIAPLEGRVLVTEEEIFGQRTKRSAPARRPARALLEDLRALEPGDYVVHVDHGIGRYLGLEKKEVAGGGVDLLVVEYARGDKLFLPVHRLNQVQKYSGGDGSPKLDRLGGQTFARTKARVRRRVREMADELLTLYANRQAAKKAPLPPPGDDYAELEATFPFEETRDQAAAIAEVARDLESDRVMDRLVCGDVGFGKTEVALRAAFRNAIAGRQTALLCPTTVLAQQHYLTFSRRLADFPIEIRALSRFSSKAEQQATVQALRKGTVDIVIGTHRLLSKDVHFHNLGLLVVDEEQRFGVTHKERIKQLRANVDVLTLTATPIPRTLQLAIGGLRDMSIITTAPVDRRAIRTITSQFDESVVREAIERELDRGGQVFYVYNRVEDIYERASKVAELVPRARVAVGHGQLKESVLERTMLGFVEGRFDVLVSTAIIESGLDIPRANTMIVDRADLFGLSQLYQLRGRVGRSSERAYCYLLVPPASQLTDEARYRIEALERYTELGTGFQVATLDMEQRGAGNFLGGEQSGFVASVGFDLFCQMLEEATHELRGEQVIHEVEPELTFDVDALLPESYITEVGVRLSLYKRLASAASIDEVGDLAGEMEDRFGTPPPEARRLVDLMRLKTELRQLRALGCEANRNSVTLHLREDTPLDPEKVGALVGRKGSQYRLTPDMRLSRRAKGSERFDSGIAHAARLLDELGSCRRDP